MLYCIVVKNQHKRKAVLDRIEPIGQTSSAKKTSENNCKQPLHKKPNQFSSIIITYQGHETQLHLFNTEQGQLSNNHKSQTGYCAFKMQELASAREAVTQFKPTLTTAFYYWLYTLIQW